jgi:hypothetical protein
MSRKGVIMFAVKLKEKAKNALWRLFHDQSGEVNVIATVVLIVIALGLIIIFRSGITSVLNSLMESINQNAEKATQD